MTERDHDARCVLCQEELSVDAAALSPRSSAHLDGCGDCQAFAAHVHLVARNLRDAPVTPAPSDLTARTLERMAPVFSDRMRRTRQRVGRRLTLAGALSLPVILAANGAWGYLLYTALGRIAPVAVTDFVLYILAASTLLGLSLVYGSLPLLASWVLRPRPTLMVPGLESALLPGTGRPGSST